MTDVTKNAIKFTETGSIKIHASLVDEDETSFTVQNEIADTGVGIPETVPQEELFAPFTQFDASSTKHYKGTGLGLSICKSLTELMGGCISFRPNAEKHGSIFCFTVKLRKIGVQQQADRMLERLKSPPIAQFHDTKALIKEIAPGKRILLAEDNLISQKVMTMLLNGLGFSKVDVAADGREALAKAREDSHDLILMDIGMPFLDGVSATVEIRALSIDTPIIAVTANAEVEDVRSYLAHGMNGYVAKPVDRQILMDALLEWLQ